MSLFTNFNNQLNPSEKATAKTRDFPMRNTRDFDGMVRITSITDVEKGDMIGSVIVHMQNANMQKANEEIQLWFTPQTANSNETAVEWESRQFDNIYRLFTSAGLIMQAKTLADADKEMREKLIKKDVKIRQYHKGNYNNPNISIRI